MIKKFFKFAIHNSQAGMTYVELIVVLSIFATMTSVVLFNYNAFQEKVDIKILATDIASKIVEAQKSAMAGKINSASNGILNWKPSYGVYFDSPVSGNNQDFVYFTDLDSSHDYTDASFCSFPGTGECLDKIHITKNNRILNMKVFYTDGTPTATSTFDNLSINFTRPDSGANIKLPYLSTVNMSYVQITVSSPSGMTANVNVYPSGRIQIN